MIPADARIPPPQQQQQHMAAGSSLSNEAGGVPAAPAPRRRQQPDSPRPPQGCIRWAAWQRKGRGARWLRGCACSSGGWEGGHPSNQQDGGAPGGDERDRGGPVRGRTGAYRGRT